MIDAFHRALNDQLNEELAKQIESMSAGACPSFEFYMNRVGYIEAIRRVQAICGEISQKIHGTKD